MKLKFEWCNDKSMPCIERCVEYVDHEFKIIITPIVPDIGICQYNSLLTSEALTILNNYAEDLKNGIVTLQLTISPDINEIDFIDWM